MKTLESIDLIAEELRKYIAAKYLLDSEPDDLKTTDLLFESGIIDSAGAISLIMHLEERYGIEIMEEELFPNNFATIDHIVRFIEGKRAGRL